MELKAKKAIIGAVSVICMIAVADIASQHTRGNYELVDDLELEDNEVGLELEDDEVELLQQDEVEMIFRTDTSIRRDNKLEKLLRSTLINNSEHEYTLGNDYEIYVKRDVGWILINDGIVHILRERTLPPNSNSFGHSVIYLTSRFGDSLPEEIKIVAPIWRMSDIEINGFFNIPAQDIQHSLGQSQQDSIEMAINTEELSNGSLLYKFINNTDEEYTFKGRRAFVESSRNEERFDLFRKDGDDWILISDGNEIFANRNDLFYWLPTFNLLPNSNPNYYRQIDLPDFFNDLPHGEYKIVANVSRRIELEVVGTFICYYPAIEEQGKSEVHY